MPDFVIRTATRTDLPRFLDLLSHLISDDARCSQEDAVLALDCLHRYEGSVVLLGEIGDDLIATCTLVVIPNFTRGGKPYALIENVVTHADHRNCGFGRQILNAAVGRAWQAGCYKVMLMTSSLQRSTLSFYESAGFSQTETGFQIRQAGG